MSKKIIFVILASCFVLVLHYPYQTISIPEWQVQVVDRLDNPIPNAKISQAWSTSRREHRETLVTDANGTVIFPARITRSSLFLRTITKLLDKIIYLAAPHGALEGLYATVFSAEGARTNWLHYSKGSQLEHKLIFQDYP